MNLTWRSVFLFVAVVLFVSAVVVGWTSDDPIFDVVRDCVTLIAAGLAVYVASHFLAGER